jgi:glycosyltransferase involved in cell wall biosynthesis
MFKSSASYKQALRKIAFRMTDQKVIARADCVIAPSTDIRQEIIDHCKAEASKIKTIPNGIDMQLFRPHAVDKAYVRTRYGLDFEYVLFVGRLVEEKAVQTIVKAVAGTQLNAVIVGDGPMLGSLRELASRLGVSRQVHFLGSIARSELPGIYSQAAIFALPSLAEGMPLAGLEAMASGLPIVASSTSGMSGALRDGYNGYFVDPGRHDSLRRRLVQLNEDVSLRKVMGRNSRRIIESEYSWEKTARRTLDVYRTLIA